MSTTRLLILGVLMRKQPIHGYDVRRELELWNAEQWANIAYGSIYFALNKMAEEGLVEAAGTDQVGNRPARTAYTITEPGRQEFERLLREYWWQEKPVIDPFQVAVTFMDRMPREELLAALRHRADQLRAALAAWDWATAAKMTSPGTPRHVAEQLSLSKAHKEATLRWLDRLIGKVECGDLPGDTEPGAH
jgi:DNA-binding PadR family transcriptional regulator